MTVADAPLWTPSDDRIAGSTLTAFMAWLHDRTGATFSDYADLWQWSVDNHETFWALQWDYHDIIADTRGDRTLIDGDKMPGATFFPDARLNYAENLLAGAAKAGGDDALALVFRGEDKVERTLTWQALKDAVAQTTAYLKSRGVGVGDRVAGFMPNMPETIIAMLATNAVGAIWSSASPDFGVQGVLDRFGQIEPKVLIAVEGYFYNGKTIDCLAKVGAVVDQIPSVTNVLMVPYTRDDADITGIRGARHWPEALADHAGVPLSFTRLPFNHPLFIMFSSGTTGVPKCIVHGQGGTLLQHVKEHRLHCDVRPGDRVFYFTTCGWMMWNWLVTGLACGETVLLYDGSPFYPDGNVLFDYADAWEMTFFGTSAKYIDALKKQGFKPRETHSLASVRAMASTGSPLAQESFDYVYQDIKHDIHLASISGGTDIISCFALGVPTRSVYRGELQARGLGMAVDVYDDDGQPIRQEKGELVCTKPFPSMPVMFWNDPDGARYHGAYFERFDNIWCHGDFVEITAHDGVIIYGRSDATLNPGGVRIGTAEIYRAVEQLPEVIEAVAIGQDWDNDVRVVLFVVLKAGAVLDDVMTDTIKKTIRSRCTPRHVPARIVAVTDIPRTKSGKITELAIRDVVHGRPIKNVEALANPESLDQYRNREELAS